MENQDNIQTLEAAPTKPKKYAIWIHNEPLKKRIQALRRQTGFGVEDFFNYVLNIYEAKTSETIQEAQNQASQNDRVQ